MRRLMIFSDELWNIKGGYCPKKKFNQFYCIHHLSTAILNNQLKAGICIKEQL
jgi:hypothetical protein